MRDLVHDRVGTDDSKVIIDSFTLGDIPFQETDESVTAAQVRC
jgi:hypothetical protein